MVNSENKIKYNDSIKDIEEIREIEDSYKPICNTYCNWLESNNLGLNLYSFKKYYWYLISEHKAASTINANLAMMKKRYLYVFEKINNMIDKKMLLEYKMNTFKAPSKVNRGLSSEKLFSNEEINKMISLTGPRTSLIIEFLYRTACRRSELCNILLKDCREKRHYVLISIYGKGNKIREIPIKKDLLKRIKNVFNGKVYLFEDNNNKKYTGKVIWDLVSTPSEKILNRHMSPHMIRHSRLTHIRKNTGDLKATSIFAGHARTSTTADIYDHSEFDPNIILD